MTTAKGFKCKKRHSQKYLLTLAVSAALSSGFSLSAASAGIIKSDTATMNASADWSGTAPTISTVGEFSNVISAAHEAALTLGGNVSLMGLLFDNNLNGPVTIANTGGFTLTLGSSGIDMSAANQNVTINSIIALQASQSWNVVTGRTLTVGGNIISGAAGTQTLTLNGTSNTSISGAIGGGTGTITLIQSSAGTTTLSGVNTYTGGTTISAGVISIGSASNLPSASTLTLSGSGMLNMTANMTLANNVTIASGQNGILKVSGTAGTNILSGNYSGVAGTLTLDISAVTSFNGFNVTSANGLAAGSVVNVIGATTGNNAQIVDQSSASQAFFANALVIFPTTGGNTAFSAGNSSATNITFGALAGGISSTNTGSYLGTVIGFDNRTGTVTIAGTVNGNYSGTIFNGNGSAGGLTFIKNGSSTQTLSGANTYTGPSMINAGALQIGNGGTTGSISTSSAITDNASLIFNRTDTYGGAISNAISGTGGLTQAGSGTLTLTGANSYVGTTISAGVLQIGNAGTAGTLGTGGVTDNSSLVFKRTDTYGGAISQIISGTGSLTQAGTGTLTLSGSNTYTGTTNLNAGVINLGVGEVAGTSGPLGKSAAANAGSIVFNGGTLQYSASNTNDYSGRFAITASQPISIDTNGQNITFATALQGTSSTLAKLGTGTLVLTGTSTYTGNTTITLGTLQIGTAGQLGSGTYAGAIANSGTLEYSSTIAQTLSGNITGTNGTLIKDTSTSTLTLTGTNTYSGGTTISAGVISIGSASNLPSASTLTLSGSGALNMTAAMTLANNVVIATGQTGTLKSANGGNTTLSGNYTGMAGTLTLDMSTNTGFTGFTPTSNNGPAGTVSVLAVGQSQLGGAGTNFWANTILTLPATGLVYMNGAGQTTWTFGALAGGNANTLIGFDNQSGDTFNIQGIANATFAGTIFNGAGTSGANKLVKNGSGTQTLSGANTYTGTTTINNGAIQIGAASNLSSSSALTLASGGALNMTANMTLANNVTIASGQSGTLRMIGATTGVLSGNYSGVAGTLTLDVSGGSSFSGISTNSANGPALGSVVNILGTTNTNNVQVGTTIAADQGFFANAKVSVTATGSGDTYLAFGNGSATNAQFGALDGGNATTLIGFDNVTGMVTINGTTNGNFAGTIFNGNSGGPLQLIKTGAATQTLTGANTYTGLTTINGGVLAVNAVATGATAQPLGENGSLTLAGGTLRYTGGGGTLDKAITVNTATTGTISNTGGGTMTLTGGISKNGSTLILTGGNFNITTKPITGASAGSDLIVSGSTVTLSVANTYVGPTSVVSAGKIVLGINNAIPSNSAVTLGDGSTTGTLTMGGFTNSIGSLAFGAGTGTVAMAANQTGTAQLNASGSVTLGSAVNTLDFTGMSTSAGLYKLISGSSLTGTFGTVTGLNSAYVLRYGTVNTNELDAQHLADQTITGTITLGRLIAGQSLTGVTLGTLNNTSPAGGTSLSVASLSATDSAGAPGTFTITAPASSVAANSSATITSNFATAGTTTLGTRNFNVTNIDNNALTGTATLTTGTVDVVTSRVITAGSVNFGRVILGNTAAAQSSGLTTTGSHDTTANLTVNNGASGSSGGITASSGSAQLFNSAGNTGTLTVTNGTPFGSTGTQTGTVTLASGTGNFTGELTGQTLGPVTVGYSIDPVNERTYTSPVTVTLGNFLLNANEVVSSNQTITTTGLHDVTADATLGSSTSGTIDGLSLSGGPDFVDGSSSPVNLTRTISGTLATNSYGTANGTFNMNSVDEFANTITNAASVSYTANVGLATAALSDRGGTNSADRLAYQMTSTETGSQTLFNGTVLTAVVGNTDSYAGLASKTIAGGTVLGTVATILAGTNQSGGTNTVAMTWRDRSTLERPGGSIPPLPATVGSPRYLISDVVLLTGMNSGAGSTLDTNHTIAGNPYTITNHQTDDFVLQMSYSGGANPTLDWLDPSDSYWKLANAGDFGGNDASGGELDFIGSFNSFQTTYGSTLSAYLGAYGYDPTTSVAWAVINHNSQFAVMGEVPEPTSLGLLGLGALALLSRRRNPDNSGLARRGRKSRA